MIHPNVEMGDDCLIRQNVAIGAPSHERCKEAPKLGSRVQVGSGAAILGNIAIGDDARIGPNAVVMTHVPAGAAAFGNPARIVVAPKKEDKQKKMDQGADTLRKVEKVEV